MEHSELRSAIIERLNQVGDLSKLDAILRLLEISATQWSTDSDLIGNVLIAEQEYASGKAVSFDAARFWV